MGDMNNWNQDEGLRFQDYQQDVNFSGENQNMNIQYGQSPISRYSQNNSYENYQTVRGAGEYYDDEPPLLEELEIEPDKILKRMSLILDPFHSCVYLEEYDLMGPLLLCILLPTILLLLAKNYFSYVYGLGTLCSVMMYALLTVMSTTHNVSLSTVASILGYGLLPQIILALLGVLMPLYSLLGFGLALGCVLWSSFATSRIFAVMMNSTESFLIGYPCALIYSVFTLLVLF